MTNAPEIRFKGFTHAWEQRKLGEIVEKQKSYPLSRDVETAEATGYRYIHYGDIHKQVADMITADDQLPRINKGNYLPLEQGDLILADASEDYTGVAEPSVILHEPAEKIIAGLHTIAMRPQSANSLYLYHLLHTEKFKKYGSHVGTGLKVFGITFYNLSLFETSLPSIEEQTAIGQFFHTLDDTITLHKRKLGGLKKLKTGYLQQMFPQAGECVPRVRFAGFAGDWVEWRIGDIFEVTRGQVLAATAVSPEKTQEYAYPVYSSQTKSNGLMGYYMDFLFDTAITWTTDGANAGTVNYREGKFYSTNVNGVLLSRDGYANQCIAEALNMVAWKYVSKVGNPKLMNNIMAEIKIKIPALSEQTAIGNFFRTLDEQITAQSQNVEQLRQLKAAYLQKMFI